MHYIGKLIVTFLAALGVLFLLEVALLAYLWYADPLELRPFVESVFTGNAQPQEGEVDEQDAHPLLDSEQEAVLRRLGMDPAALPREVSPELEACARRELGDERVDEIRAGAKPSAADLAAARSCL